MTVQLKNKELDEINQKYIQVEGKVPFSNTFYDTLQTEDGRKDIEMNGEMYMEIYHEAFDYCRALSPHLSTDEVIDGFLNGTKMLQRNMSGCMVSEQFFDEAYIPVMIDSINEDRLSNNSHFLHFLSRELPEKEMRELILVSLESKISQVRNVALQLVSHHKITEAEDKAREMLNDPELFVRDQPREQLRVLRKINNFLSE